MARIGLAPGLPNARKCANIAAFKSISAYSKERARYFVAKRARCGRRMPPSALIAVSSSSGGGSSGSDRSVWRCLPSSPTLRDYAQKCTQVTYQNKRSSQPPPPSPTPQPRHSVCHRCCSSTRVAGSCRRRRRLPRRRWRHFMLARRTLFCVDAHLLRALQTALPLLTSRSAVFERQTPPFAFVMMRNAFSHYF